MHLTLALLLPLMLAAPSARADSCEAIRTDIEAKLRASSVVSYALLTVDLADTQPGKVVGSCAMGKKKIVYQAQGATAAQNEPTPIPRPGQGPSTGGGGGTTPAPGQATVVSTQQIGSQGTRRGTVITSTQIPAKGTPVPRAPASDYITECKDGSMSVGGECKP
jgi:hypothetical protein